MIHPPPAEPAAPLSDEDRRASLDGFLATRPSSGPVRVFAYGSLLWDPCFAFTERQTARLDGWVRRTCLWSLHARGSPEAPGLFYGLDRDDAGMCDGAVFTLAEEGLREGLERLWDREMHTAVYRPAWLEVATPSGPVTAIGFLVERDHPLYAGEMSAADAARFIRKAEGVFGPCADYYRATVEALATEGFNDPHLSEIVRLLDETSAA